MRRRGLSSQSLLISTKKESLIIIIFPSTIQALHRFFLYLPHLQHSEHLLLTRRPIYIKLSFIKPD
jgi:hypothetical protein